MEGPVWLQIALIMPPFLVAVVLHEYAHGWVANRLGDSTAARAGRLTLNPIPHVDPIGSVAVPGLLFLSGSPFVFGWARPVPVVFGNLRNPKRDMVKVAVAGPLMNIALAAVFALAIRVLLAGGMASDAVAIKMLLSGVLINLILAVFNMLPILPLDGGRVLTGLLPLPQARSFARLEPYGLLIVVGLLYTNMLDVVMWPVVEFLFTRLL